MNYSKKLSKHLPSLLTQIRMRGYLSKFEVKNPLLSLDNSKFNKIIAGIRPVICP